MCNGGNSVYRKSKLSIGTIWVQGLKIFTYVALCQSSWVINDEICRYKQQKSHRKSKRGILVKQVLQEALDIETQDDPICHPCFQIDPSWTSDGALCQFLGLKQTPDFISCVVSPQSDPAKSIVYSTVPLAILCQISLYFYLCGSHLSTPFKDYFVAINLSLTYFTLDLISSGLQIKETVLVWYQMCDYNGNIFTIEVEVHWVPQLKCYLRFPQDPPTIFSLFSHLNSARHNLIIKLCCSFKIVQFFQRVFSKFAHNFVAI